MGAASFTNSWIKALDIITFEWVKTVKLYLLYCSIPYTHPVILDKIIPYPRTMKPNSLYNKYAVPTCIGTAIKVIHIPVLESPSPLNAAIRILYKRITGFPRRYGTIYRYAVLRKFVISANSKYSRVLTTTDIKIPNIKVSNNIPFNISPASFFLSGFLKIFAMTTLTEIANP